MSVNSLHGNVDITQIVEKFPDEDKVVCNSLLSWAHDGSHHVNDDLFVDTNQESNRTYFNVFNRIFINSGHSHFNMMMEGFENGRGDQTSNEEAKREYQEALSQVAASQE